MQIGVAHEYQRPEGRRQMDAPDRDAPDRLQDDKGKTRILEELARRITIYEPRDRAERQVESADSTKQYRQGDAGQIFPRRICTMM